MSRTRFDTRTVSDSITRPSNTTAYAAGDVISEVTTNDFHTFSGVVNSGQNSGVINAARCMISAAQGTLPDLELWLFDTTITEVADNSAFAVTDAEVLTLIDVIPFSLNDWYTGSGNIVQTVKGIDMPFTLPAASGSAASTDAIYGQLVVRNAYTPTSAETYQVELLITAD